MKKIAIAFAAILMATSVHAQTISPGGFHAAFPCEVKRAGDGIKSITAWCVNADGAFRVDVSVNAPGASDEDAFKAAIDAVGKDTGSAPRLQREIARNGQKGREIITDIASQGFTERDQFWTINGILYRVCFMGATGAETGKIATDFLESFSTTP
ncbi:MAG: hypothetical protein WCA81_07900 [Rhizomicrobium sp.]